MTARKEGESVLFPSLAQCTAVINGIGAALLKPPRQEPAWTVFESELQRQVLRFLHGSAWPGNRVITIYNVPH